MLMHLKHQHLDAFKIANDVVTYLCPTSSDLVVKGQLFTLQSSLVVVHDVLNGHCDNRIVYRGYSSVLMLLMKALSCKTLGSIDNAGACMCSKQHVPCRWKW